MAEKYDVGVLGWWYGKNYGSILTYYGLNKAITNFGYSVLMIHEPLGYNKFRVKWPLDILSLKFARRAGYNSTNQEHFSELPLLNDVVDTFLVGSDQLWNPNIGRVNDDLFLDFVSSDNKKIAYATSFGNKNLRKFKPDFLNKHRVNLQEFQSISVRESYAVEIAKEAFGVEATQVADPVFLLEESDYEQLADGASFKATGSYLATFFLDLTPEKRRLAEAIADKLDIEKIVVIPNPDKGRSLADEIFVGDRFELLSEDSPENFLSVYRGASYVLTDSFHGTAFAVMFKKPFSSVYNTKRGADRFANLLDSLGFDESRRVYETDTREIIQRNPNVSLSVDFSASTKVIEDERKRSLNWLNLALKEEHQAKSKVANAEKQAPGAPCREVPTAASKVPVLKTNAAGIQVLSEGDLAKLSVPVKQAAKGNWIWCELTNELVKGSRYRLEIDWSIETESSVVNIHLMKSTNAFKVVGSVPAGERAGARSQDQLEFVAAESGYSRIMLGAMHFNGNNAGANIYRLSVEEAAPAGLPAGKEISARGSAKHSKASVTNFGVSLSETLPLRDALLSNEFVFFRAGSGGEPIRQNVKFLSDGSLQNVSHKNEYAWELSGNKLALLSREGKPTTVFENLRAEYAAGEMRLTGKFLPNPSVKHVLEAVPTSVARANSDPDFARVKLLVSKLRDYGIKDVVLSPGGRDVVLNRAIENHPELFNVHYLLDERSAGYFALGVANKTQRTTAVVVTSGTAASNLAPAITEAYYMNLPILAITADRYPEYHGIGEDQTIEQANMFEPMVRKSVDLTGGMGNMSDAFVARQISDAILSTKYGPAHINVPTNNLPHQAPINAAYELPSVRNIQCVSATDSESHWEKYAKKLLASKKILLLYRQSYKPTPEQLDHITKFAERYNVVIAADWLSNISGPHIVHPFNVLRGMTQSQFNSSLLPDLVISVGTKNVMNHPINFKLRGAPSIPHWDVEPHGELRDLYFKLTDVLHVSKDWFFKRFAEWGEGHTNDSQYLNSWKEAVETHKPQVYQEYNNHFVVQQVLENIPENSLFHIGVGSSFMLTHTVNTVPNKELEVFLNMGTNGIDGSASAFMGQIAVDESDRLKVLLIGDVSFFYDMNSIWNKNLNPNTRIMLVNNSGSSLLKHYGSKASYAPHSTAAEGWVKSVGFTYLSSKNRAEYEENLQRFFSKEATPLFFEVFL